MVGKMLAHKGELTLYSGFVHVIDIDEKNKREYM